MRLAELEQDELANNRLQARKSSFQAWKVASFGCSLLVLVLLLSKLHEVSTDLSLLQGIERLLSNGSPLNLPTSLTNSTIAGTTNSSATSDLASYLINSDLNGHELLRAEVDSFTGEHPCCRCCCQLPGFKVTPANHDDNVVSSFTSTVGRPQTGIFANCIAEIKGSKSTLILSSLLVFVYLVSWTLMSLAISDVRISVSNFCLAPSEGCVFAVARRPSQEAKKQRSKGAKKPS